MSLDNLITGISSASAIRKVVLSPSASKLIYQRSTLFQSPTPPNTESTLWIADIAPGSKSRQLTSSGYNDTSPIWSNDESEVYFLSNRHKQDGAAGPPAIYALPLKVGGEPYSISSTESKSAIGAFWLSPDGRHIAYTAAREPTAAEEQKQKQKDDPIVFGDKRENNQLWLMEIATRQVRRLSLGPKDDWHVVTVAWSPDSKSLVVMAPRNWLLEFREAPTALLRVSLLPSVNGVEEVCMLPRINVPTLLWPSSDEIALLQSFIPEHIPASIALFYHPATSQGADQGPWKKYYGDVEDVWRVSEVGDGKTLSVAIGYGVQTRVDLIDSTGAKKTLWKPTDEVPTGTYDVKGNKDGDYVLAIVNSSGVRCEPAELWIGSISASKLHEGSMLKLTDKVSSHNTWTDALPKIVTEVIRYKAKDGTSLEGIITWLKGTERKALPTILYPHGGPYYRDVPGFTPEIYWCKDMLALAGYLVLSPQYRGSMGRGHDFAYSAHAQMGTHDWTDCYDLLQHAVSQGWVHQEKMGLAGWSQGGFLTAWGLGQTKDVFKAAVMGCGITDWATLLTESEEPDFQADLAGAWPWSENRVDIKASPITHVKGIKTPLLILHGQEDQCCPVSQGIEFHRGLRRASGYPDNHQLIIYPREGHMLFEQKHVEDALRRMIEHLDTHLK
ncbi:alpha/beta-hydrolase [Calocera cornea HHB12733]|uniref:Dipeptidyl-peptidase V n=1 Tax=Calocera cornea HHB12733 TaxID=1353952 RepID=A0A165ERS5_9BASI|nr:alpha/beta-hydrolase [Calocera cornea HHB12733]